MEYDRPFLSLISDLAGGIFAFDTRLRKSLGALLTRPGGMETDFTDGRRARYVPPFKLYLFISFFFFLLLSTITDQMLESNRSFFSSIARGEQPSEPIITLPSQTGGLPADKTETRSFLQVSVDTASSSVNDDIHSPDEQKVRDIFANPQMYMGRFFRYFTWSLFILMPLYGSLLWLFFRGSRHYYLPHFLLSMNQHLIAFVILSFVMLPQLLWPHREMGWEGYLNFTIPLYHIIGAKRLYALSFRSTFFRLFGAQTLYMFATLIVVAIVAYFALV